MKPLNECLYYLVREMGGLGARAKDVYFDDALAGLKEPGRPNFRRVEMRALVYAPRRRNRLSELDKVMGYEPSKSDRLAKRLVMGSNN